MIVARRTRHAVPATAIVAEAAIQASETVQLILTGFRRVLDSPSVGSYVRTCAQIAKGVP
jgi:hypothetical protein